MNRKLRQAFDLRSVFSKRALDDAKIEAGNDDVVPTVTDSAQRHIQHSDDLMTERFLAFDRDRAKELLTFGVTRIVRAGVRLLSSKVDFLPDPARDFLGMRSKKIAQRPFLQARRKLLGCDFAVPMLANLVSVLDEVKPASKYRSTLFLSESGSKPAYDVPQQGHGSFLFVAQGRNWIDARGPVSGNATGQNQRT